VDGTTADLCSSCVVGFDRVSSKCQPCTENEVVYRILVLLLLLVLVLVLLARARKKMYNLYRRYFGAFKDATLAMKIGISFFQINISMPMMMSSFEYPDNYRAFLNRLSFINVDLLSVIGVQCMVDVDYRYSMLFSLCMPIIVVLGTFCVYIAFMRMVKKKLHTYNDQDRAVVLGTFFDYGDADASNDIDLDEFYNVFKTVQGIRTLKTMTQEQSRQLLTQIGGRVWTINAGKGNIETMTIHRDKFVQGMLGLPVKQKQELGLNKIIQWVKRNQMFSWCASLGTQMLLLIHAPVSAKAFYYFDCHVLGKQRQLLRQDYRLDCQSDEYNQFMPVAVLLVFG